MDGWWAWSDPEGAERKRELQVNTKYKPVGKKTRPQAVEVDATHRQPLRRPPFDPPVEYTPLDWPIPIWNLPRPTSSRITDERLAAMNFGPPGFLHDDEREAIIKVTLHHDFAFSFTRAEKGLLSLDYADPYIIKMVPHQPWALHNIPPPKARMEEVRELYRTELDCGDLEPSDSPYNNPHFFVHKSNGKLRKVVDTTHMNKYVIRDLNVPPHLGDFIDDLAGRVCYGSADGHSYFDQIRLHEDSRPLTAIHLPGYGHYQSTRLPQGMTNAPAYAQRVSTHVFFPMIPERAQVYVDDTIIKGPAHDHGGKTLPGTNLRLWFLDYLRTYSEALRRYQHAGLTFSGDKFVAITPRLSVTGVIVDRNGKHSDPAKVARVEDWPCPPPDVSSLRGFLGLANYLRPFIKDFALVDAPLRKLLSGRWRWNDAATNAMRKLKQAARAQPVLSPIDYLSGNSLVLAVDSSQIAAGWALYQLASPDGDGTTRNLCQYGSVGFSDVESRYSQPKLELCGVYKAVRALRHSLYGFPFILEVDAASIRQMINAPDIPNAAMTRWIAYLKLFDMEVRHVPAKAHTLPDGLSRTDFKNKQAAEEWPAEKIDLGTRATAHFPPLQLDDTASSNLHHLNSPSPRHDDTHQAPTSKHSDGIRGRRRRAFDRNKSRELTMGGPLPGQGATAQEKGQGLQPDDLPGQSVLGNTGIRGSASARAGMGKTGNITMGGPSQGRGAAAQEEETGQQQDGALQGQALVTETDGLQRQRRRVHWQDQPLGHTMGGPSQGRGAASQEEEQGSQPGDSHGRSASDDTAEAPGSNWERSLLRALASPYKAPGSLRSGRDTSSGSDSTGLQDPEPPAEDLFALGPEDGNATPFDRSAYEGKWRDLGTYLGSGASFSTIKDLPAARRRWLKQQVGRFFVRRGRLFRRRDQQAPQLVIGEDALRKRLLHEAHERCGHRGRDAMAGLLLLRVWWERLPLDCLEHARSCDVCQRRQHHQEREAMRHAPVPGLFQRFNMDIVDLGPGVGPRRYLVVARDAFTVWVEARLLADKTSASVRDFLETEVLTRYGSSIDTILTDNGTENAGETAFIIQQLGFRHAHSTPYNPEGNTEVERGHGPLVEGLLRASYDDRDRTATYLPYLLWADRITTRRTTGFSPYELVFGQHPVLPMDVELQTFLFFDWSLVRTTADLLAARTRQLKRRTDDLHLARLRLEHSRAQGRQYADERNAHLLRSPLPSGVLVLSANRTHQARGDDRWHGPYRVSRQLPGGSYLLEELDGTPLPRPYAAKDLRRYFARAVPAAAATLPTQPLPVPPVHLSSATPVPHLPRARSRRPPVPIRDIPPGGQTQPNFSPAAIAAGIGAGPAHAPPPSHRIPPHLLLPSYRRIQYRPQQSDCAGPAPASQ